MFPARRNRFERRILPKRPLSYLAVLRARPNPFSLLLPCFLVATGCSTRHFKKSADEEAFKLIREKSGRVTNMQPGFSLDTNTLPQLEGLAISENPGAFLGEQSSAEVGAKILPLDRALEVAVAHGREYQLRKESLYLEALSLSLSRYRYTPIFGGSLSASYQTRSLPADKVTVGVDAVTGQPRVLIEKDAALVEQSLIQPQGTLNANVLLATGARLSAAFSTDFLRFLTGDPMPEATAGAFGQIIQPLWRGAGFKATLENLIQAERNLLYEMRDFVAWQKQFSVQIASDYYGVLQARDTVRNSWADLTRSRQNVARERAFAEAGQRPLASLDQLRQQELNSETRWVDSVRAYREALDRFKISLGIRISDRIVLDDTALSNLRILDPTLPIDQALQVAHSIRLDLLNLRDRVQDSERQVVLAKNRLRPEVNLIARASMDQRRNGHLVLPDPNQYRWSAGLQADLPFDRKAERNGYRQSLIQVERSKRALDFAEEQLKLEIFNNLRALDQAKRNLQNAELGIKLAERRVEEQELRMELGRGVTRDLLDAQADLNQARNARTAAIVSHTTARLRFFRDLGILYIRPDGRWEALPEVQSAASSPALQPPAPAPPSSTPLAPQ